MKTIFRIGKDELTVTRDMILAAISEYDQTHRVSSKDAGLGYALIHESKSYPPKHILSLAINRPRSSFSGGEGKRSANRVFTDLRFHIVGTKQSKHKPTLGDVKLKASIPTVEYLVDKLFVQKCLRLHESYEDLDDAEYPGVYLIAYCDEDLSSQLVIEDKVYYVGMSHSGVARRLEQFIDGLEDGKHDSGADHFYRENGNTPYSQLPNRKTFFVAAVSVPCITAKGVRQPDDLRKMGEVSRLELYTMARILEKSASEPYLNKK